LIEWIYFPLSVRPPAEIVKIVTVFEDVEESIGSGEHQLKSNAVLSCLAPGLERLGFLVETSKSGSDKVRVPVLFGPRGQVEKAFEADAFHPKLGIVVEVEAGRAVTNNQFLKDLFQACMMSEARYLVIAVRKMYLRRDDYREVVRFFTTLYTAGRLKLPLDGILVIGY